MISRADLRKISKARLADSEALFTKRRYDGAVYLCGYAVELALKARICKTLKWAGFPELRNEFQDLQSFKVHKLDLLLKLSGCEDRIRQKHLIDWSIVATWDPEARYKRIGTAKRPDAMNMITSTRNLLGIL